MQARKRFVLAANRTPMLRMSFLASLLLLTFLPAKLHCQPTYPHVFFSGETLANHSYVNFGLVGESTSNSVQCRTDLATCCSSSEGVHRGDWFFPDGTRLGFTDTISEGRVAQRVDLRRSDDTTVPTGIYCCSISTEAVHDFGLRETVYVGLYTGDEGKDMKVAESRE